jgi:glycosyltransferase involved in cell wall biosynthesis
VLDIICAPVEVVFASSRHDRSKVTVAVTLFNYGHTVISTLESVRAQQLPDVDLIVVDDASTDSGPSTVERWMNAHAERFGRCRLVRHHHNQGLAGARNQAFSLATTPFVFSLDADNQLYPRCLHRCLTLAERSDADAVYTLIEVFGEERGVMGTDLWNPEYLARQNYIDAMALVRRSAWRTVGGYRGMAVQGWEDYDFWLKFAEAGLSVHRVPEILCRYRHHRHSMLRQVTNAAENIGRIHDDMRLHHPAFNPR